MHITHIYGHQTLPAPTPSVPVGDSVIHCVRGGMVVARAEAKGKCGRRKMLWDYAARCTPPRFNFVYDFWNDRLLILLL